MDSIVFDGLIYHCFQVYFCFTLCFIFGLFIFLFVVMFFPDVCTGCKDSVELKREGRESHRPQGEREHWERWQSVCVYVCLHVYVFPADNAFSSLHNLVTMDRMFFKSHALFFGLCHSLLIRVWGQLQIQIIHKLFVLKNILFYLSVVLTHC